mmetsp:Transcript_18925/g.72181  ORF Transcript_18925/g.72181 Transcript_18925/m.72181 type:complete len:243 (+) Transcript_18925:1987-2715(+)
MLRRRRLLGPLPWGQLLRFCSPLAHPAFVPPLLRRGFSRTAEHSVDDHVVALHCGHVGAETEQRPAQHELALGALDRPCLDALPLLRLLVLLVVEHLPPLAGDGLHPHALGAPAREQAEGVHLAVVAFGCGGRRRAVGCPACRRSCQLGRALRHAGSSNDGRRALAQRPAVGRHVLGERRALPGRVVRGGAFPGLGAAVPPATGVGRHAGLRLASAGSSCPLCTRPAQCKQLGPRPPCSPAG